MSPVPVDPFPDFLVGAVANGDQIDSRFAELYKTLNPAQRGIDKSNIVTTGVGEDWMAVGAAGLARGAFSAYRGAGGLSLATGGVVIFDNDATPPAADVSAWYDTATGLYTPQIPGWYRLSCSVAPAGALTADVFWQVTLRKNAAELHRGQIAYQRGTQPVQSSGTWIVQANGTTDNFAIGILHGVGAAQLIGTGTLLTYFHGELIGRA
jgi:hypothetical protein